MVRRWTATPRVLRALTLTSQSRQLRQFVIAYRHPLCGCIGRAWHIGSIVLAVACVCVAWSPFLTCIVVVIRIVVWWLDLVVMSLLVTSMKLLSVEPA